ncbi:DNA internalization-related competence protein ComEC/Rec2 [Acinetobacter boissieri]|uniref:Competence protein ComEC n=1 Tax=Acinetobacter boissieri TaxID=1219383 RepID=A0A1G6GSQ2_9GAMM|nr:DNA internalization-related competence protein ComEC/Rec2 [Acinetobacter boissieri]SDB84959.1 competence protein ComEC [Acinetobacter boissieri]
MFYAVFLAWILGHACLGGWGAITIVLPIFLFIMTLIVYALGTYVTQLRTLKRWPTWCALLLTVFCLGFWNAQQSLTIQLAQRILVSQEVRALVYIQQIDEQQPENIQQRIVVFNPSSKTTTVWQVSLSKKKFPQNPFQLGHYYWVTGKVSPIHGYAVPYAFDQEQWSLQQGVMGRLQVQSFERVLPAVLNSQIQYQPFVMKQQQLWQRLQLFLQQKRLDYRQFILQQNFSQSGLILALLSADESFISPEVQQLFQDLGIRHLLAISGPHVLVFAMILSTFCHYIIVWFFPRLYLKWPKRYVLSVPLLSGVLLYSGFVGFEIPALRTLITVILMTVFLFLKYRISTSMLILLSASMLLLIEPLSVFSAAFWLSYGACFILIVIYEKVSNTETTSNLQKIKQTLYQFFYSQIYIFIALTPITLWFFHQMSWLTPLSNWIAIPLIGIFVVPLNIFSACIYWLSPVLSTWIFGIVDYILSVFVLILSYIQSFGLQPQYYALTGWKVLILSVIALLLLLPKGVIPRLYLIPCILVLFLPSQTKAPFVLSVLDVGQGQAIFVQTLEHRMFIDTGGHFNEQHFSVAKALLLPFLMKKGVSELDQVILTHLDIDHSGAFEQLQKNIHIKAVSSNERPDILNRKTPFSYCSRGQIHTINGLTIQILWPNEQDLAQVETSSNDYSCVVYLTYQPKQGLPQHILMMGDTGDFAERQLMALYPNLKVDILLLGHHGSKYSSSLDFLQHYNPKLAIASAGYMNRYGHPHSQVQERLRQLNIPLIVTSKVGTINMAVQDNGVVNTEFYRNSKLWLNW